MCGASVALFASGAFLPQCQRGRKGKEVDRGKRGTRKKRSLPLSLSAFRFGVELCDVATGISQEKAAIEGKNADGGKRNGVRV